MMEHVFQKPFAYLHAMHAVIRSTHMEEKLSPHRHVLRILLLLPAAVHAAVALSVHRFTILCESSLLGGISVCSRESGFISPAIELQPA